MVSSHFISRRFLFPLVVSAAVVTTLILLLSANTAGRGDHLSFSSLLNSALDPIIIKSPSNQDPYSDEYLRKHGKDEDGGNPQTVIRYVTVTDVKEVTKLNTKTKKVTQTTTVIRGPEVTVTTTSYARIRPARPIPTTTSINRNFERYAGYVEDFEEKLSLQDRFVLKQVGIYGDDVAKEDSSNNVFITPRQQRLRRLYELDGAADWLKFIKENDDSAMPPLTKFAQEHIYNYQHPPKSECKNKRFIVLQHFWDKNGLGTVIHATGWILSLAMRMDRILIFNETNSPGRNFFEGGCAMGTNSGDSRSLDCIFERFSSCGEEDLSEDNYIPLKGYWKVQKEMNLPSTSIVPPVFGYALRKAFPDMHEDAMKYWWRTQAAAYTMRVNGPSLKRLKQIRTDKEIQVAFTHKPNPSASAGEADFILTEVPVPFPLPDGSFSMHIRHGDKHVEMELISFRDYVTRAEEHAAMNPISSRKICFISSENPQVFDEARRVPHMWVTTNTTSNSFWTWVYSDIPRINGGPVEQLNAFGNRTEMTIKWMSQLFLAIEGSNVLGTRGSGWNRMIDEVRCVWMDCRNGYMEVGPFEDWVHYNF